MLPSELALSSGFSLYVEVTLPSLQLPKPPTLEKTGPTFPLGPHIQQVPSLGFSRPPIPSRPFVPLVSVAQ